MKVFKDDNIGFRKWVKKNPKAYVINTKSEKGHSYRVAHLSSCKYIIGVKNPAKSTKYYIKVCGDNLQELGRWFAIHKLNFDNKFHECGDCKPNINRLIRDVSIIYSDEVDPNSDYLEGTIKRIIVNKYERSAKARGDCLAKYGYDCIACGFNFLNTYGELGKEFIHVHHLKSIADIGKSYRVNPILDLRPLCPNCHAMIHAKSPMLSINELKKILEKKASKRNSNF